MSTPTIGPGFTADQIRQLQDAFVDAMLLASCAVEEINGPIFQKYFQPNDSATVRGVFEAIRGHPPPGTGLGAMGNPALKEVMIVQDYPDELGRYADDGDTLAEVRDKDGDNPKIIITKDGFDTGGLFRGYPGVPEVNCTTIGTIVNAKMETLGSIFLHEYT